MKRAIAAFVLACVALTGCAGNPLCDHTSAGTQYVHASHVTSGPPFGPRSDEDWLDVAGVYGRCERGRSFAEVLVGASLSDGGFAGGDEVFIGRVGVELWGTR